MNVLLWERPDLEAVITGDIAVTNVYTEVSYCAEVATLNQSNSYVSLNYLNWDQKCTRSLFLHSKGSTNVWLISTKQKKSSKVEMNMLPTWRGQSTLYSDFCRRLRRAASGLRWPLPSPATGLDAPWNNLQNSHPGNESRPQTIGKNEQRLCWASFVLSVCHCTAFNCVVRFDLKFAIFLFHEHNSSFHQVSFR